MSPSLPSGASTFFIPFQQPPRSFLGARRFCRFEHEPPVLSLLMNCDLPWNLDYLDKEV